MKNTWHLIYNRHTTTISTKGLQAMVEGFITHDEHVKIKLGIGFELKRKAFSYAPVFIHTSEHLVVVASHYLTMLSLLKDKRVSLEIDTHYAIDYLRYQCPWTYGTLCKQVQILRNGEEINIPKKGEEVRKLTPLLTEINTPPDIQSYLSNSLNKLNFEKTIFHISSGLDSSALVLLAAKISSPKQINAITCETLGNGASNELDIVKKLANDIGFNLQIADFKAVDVFTAGKRLVQNCLGYPIAHPSHLIEYLLDQSVSDYSDVIISGRGPDECLGGYVWHQPAFNDRRKYLDRMRVTSDNVIRDLFKTDIPLPTDQFENHLAHENGKVLSLHDRLQIDQRTITEAWGVVHSGIELGLGVNIIKPFQDSQLSSRLFNLGDEMMLTDTTQKVYLRENMSPYYLDYLLDVPKQGFRLDLKPYMEKSDMFLEEILASKFVDQYINKSEVLRMYDCTITGIHNYGWQLWSIYLLAHSSALIYN